MLDNDHVRSLPYLDEKDIPQKPVWKQGEESKRSNRYQFRPAYIAVATVCIVVLLSFTPPVQALAKSIYTTVVNWFTQGDEEHIVVQHGPESSFETSAEEPELRIFEYNSIDGLPDRYKIVYITNDKYALNKIIAQENESEYYCEYYFGNANDGSAIISVSYSYLDASYSAMFSADEGESIFTKTKDGLEVTGIYYEDQRGAATAYYNRAQIYFNTQEGLSYDDFVEFIESTEIIY